MRRAALVIVLLALVLSNCGRDQPNASGKGATGPGGIMLGMSRSEVVQSMLEEVQSLQMSGRVTNPYSTRYIRDRNGESLEVMYYYMGKKKADNQVSDSELVPIILKKDAVVGWGWEILEGMTGSRLGPESGK